MSRAAQQFGQWLGTVHPEIYQAVYAHVMTHGSGAKGSNRSQSLRGLGDDDFDTEYGSADFSDPALTDISVDTDNLEYVEASSEGDAADALPLFDSPSSPISQGASSVTSSTAKVNNSLTSPSVVTAIANLGVAVLKTVATVDVAHAQMAVVNAQAQRAQQGQSPAPISYIQGPNGQMIPVYDTGMASGTIPSSLEQAIASGQSQAVTLPDGSTGYTLNSSTLSSVLGSNSSLLLIAGGALLLLLALSQGN